VRKHKNSASAELTTVPQIRLSCYPLPIQTARPHTRKGIACSVCTVVYLIPTEPACKAVQRVNTFISYTTMRVNQKYKLFNCWISRRECSADADQWAVAALCGNHVSAETDRTLFDRTCPKAD